MRLSRKPHATPDPVVIITGCRGWPVAAESDRCGVCQNKVIDYRGLAVCLGCFRGSPSLESMITNATVGNWEQVRAEDERRREIAAQRELGRQYTSASLTERDRRLIWNGYKGSFKEESAKTTSLTKAGRDFLERLGQCPDWNLILDRRGNIVGRYEIEVSA